jgi:hypothetical protein
MPASVSLHCGLFRGKLLMLRYCLHFWIGLSLLCICFRRSLGARCLVSACPQGVNCDLFVRNLLPLHYGLLFSRIWLYFLYTGLHCNLAGHRFFSIIIHIGFHTLVSHGFSSCLDDLVFARILTIISLWLAFALAFISFVFPYSRPFWRSFQPEFL